LRWGVGIPGQNRPPGVTYGTSKKASEMLTFCYGNGIKNDSQLDMPAVSYYVGYIYFILAFLNVRNAFLNSSLLIPSCL